MRRYKLSLVAGGFAVVLAACATATPEPAPEPTSVPAPTEEEAMEEMVPSVTVSDQDASAGTVTIEKVVADQPGWIVIHITKGGGPGPVIGQSAVSVGENANVEVAIDLDQATQQLFAMLHLDVGAVGEYEFPGDDVPVFVDDVIVNVPFNATFPITDSVSVSDQDASEGVVSIDQVVASQPGWLVIHVTRGGGPGPVIGNSAVIVGSNPDLAVEIDLSQATGQLFAMLHLDVGTEGVYEFPGDDVPVFVDDVIVNVPFQAAFPIEDAVTASDQAAADGTVTVDLVSAIEPGWIVIHAEADGGPGPVIGFAAIEVGNNANVAVEIDLDGATETLYAMLHLDLGAAGAYEFPGEDAPVFDAGGNVVLAPFALLESQAAAGEQDVKVVDINFEMKVITVPVGTTVTWVYDASLPHTATSDTNLFDSGTLGDGDQFSYTFDEVGTFPYFCRFHGGAGGSGMSGIVNVTEG